MSPFGVYQANSCFEMADGVIFQEIHEDVVVLSIATEQYYGLDSVGARVWNLLIDRSDLESVLHCIGTDYDVDTDTARADILSLVEDFVGKGLLKPVYYSTD